MMRNQMMRKTFEATGKAQGTPIIAAVTTSVRSRRTVFRLLGGGVVTAVVAGIGRREVAEAKIYGTR